MREGWFSRTEIAAYLNLHPDSIRMKVKKGQILREKIGGKYWYTLPEWEDYKKEEINFTPDDQLVGWVIRNEVENTYFPPDVDYSGRYEWINRGKITKNFPLEDPHSRIFNPLSGVKITNLRGRKITNLRNNP